MQQHMLKTIPLSSSNLLDNEKVEVDTTRLEESTQNNDATPFATCDCSHYSILLDECERKQKDQNIFNEKNINDCINKIRSKNKSIESKDQEIQKIKDLQLTQNTVVIIGLLLIIAVVVGFGIYIYFKKQ